MGSKFEDELRRLKDICTHMDIYVNKRSVLRRQSRDTNRNTKRSVYCQYG